jgi:uncharacterized damage-inducible protein DinB
MKQEKEMDISALESDFTAVLNKVIKLLSEQTDESFDREIRPGAWTIGQLAWHVVRATRDMSESPTQKSKRQYDKYVNQIEDVFLNDNVRLVAPEALIPELRKYKVEEVVRELRSNLEAGKKIIKEKDLTEQVIDNELPGWGFLTRYEWIKLMTYHVTRHTNQLIGYLAR